MKIYLKITTAIIMTAGLIELKSFIGDDDYGEFVIAFVYAGILLAGAFYLVSVIDKFLHPKKINHYRKPQRKVISTNQNRQYHPLYKR